MGGSGRPRGAGQTAAGHSGSVGVATRRRRAGDDRSENSPRRFVDGSPGQRGTGPARNRERDRARIGFGEPDLPGETGPATEPGSDAGPVCPAAGAVGGKRFVASSARHGGSAWATGTGVCCPGRASPVEAGENRQANWGRSGNPVRPGGRGQGGNRGRRPVVGRPAAGLEMSAAESLKAGSAAGPGLAGRIARSFIDSKLTPLIALASMLLGTGAIFLLPREEEPQIKVPMIDVLVAMPGFSAAEVEERATRPMEKLLWEIPGVEYIYSTSRPGESLAIVRFKVGEDVEKSLV